MSNLNIVGAKRSDGSDREKHDFYATDSRAISDLQKFVDIKGCVWECAGGDGALSRELEKIQGVRYVLTTDLVDRGYQPSVSGNQSLLLDFLNMDAMAKTHYEFRGDWIKYDWIITNPPYKHGLEFAKEALHRADNVAFLMKLVWLESKSRKPFFEKNPPSKVLVYSERLGVYKNNIKTKNKGLVAYAWFVWERHHKGDTIIKWI